MFSENLKHEKILQPLGRRKKVIRFVAHFETSDQEVKAVDQAIVRHLLRFGFFK